jgi:hypothetical protein
MRAEIVQKGGRRQRSSSRKEENRKRKIKDKRLHHTRHRRRKSRECHMTAIRELFQHFPPLTSVQKKKNAKGILSKNTKRKNLSKVPSVPSSFDRIQTSLMPLLSLMSLRPYRLSLRNQL